MLPVALLVSLPKAVLSRSLNVVSFFLAQKPCFAHNIFLILLVLPGIFIVFIAYFVCVMYFVDII